MHRYHKCALFFLASSAYDSTEHFRSSLLSYDVLPSNLHVRSLALHNLADLLLCQVVETKAEIVAAGRGARELSIPTMIMSTNF
jgi:hypothetical protein